MFEISSHRTVLQASLTKKVRTKMCRPNYMASNGSADLDTIPNGSKDVHYIASRLVSKSASIDILM
jgi:hypothetical protein